MRKTFVIGKIDVFFGMLLCLQYSSVLFASRILLSANFPGKFFPLEVLFLREQKYLLK